MKTKNKNKWLEYDGFRFKTSEVVSYQETTEGVKIFNKKGCLLIISKDHLKKLDKIFKPKKII